MSLNIIVRHGKPVEFTPAVASKLRERQMLRQQRWSREDVTRLARRTAKVIGDMSESDRRNVFVVDRQTDGRLMDFCRMYQGHTDWRRDAEFLKHIEHYDDFSQLVHGQKPQFDRLVAEAKGAELTPFHSVEKREEERRQADLSKLPARYKAGVSQ